MVQKELLAWYRVTTNAFTCQHPGPPSYSTSSSNQSPNSGPCVSSTALRSLPSTPFPPIWPQLSLPSCLTRMTTRSPHLSLFLLTILWRLKEGLRYSACLSPPSTAPSGWKPGFSAQPQAFAHPPKPPYSWAPTLQIAHGRERGNSLCLCFKYWFYYYSGMNNIPISMMSP